jgi:hypothetical protein
MDPGQDDGVLDEYWEETRVERKDDGIAWGVVGWSLVRTLDGEKHG